MEEGKIKEMQNRRDYLEMFVSFPFFLACVTIHPLPWGGNKREEGTYTEQDPAISLAL